MQVFKTTDFFNITEAEAAKVTCGYTREEDMVLDYGLEHYFFETYEAVEREVNSQKCKRYSVQNNLEVIVFEFVTDNYEHCKYCMVFA